MRRPGGEPAVNRVLAHWPELTTGDTAMESFDSLRRQLLAKVAELGGRYGLNPGDYEVDVRPGEGPKGPMALAVTSGPPASSGSPAGTR